MMQGMLQSDMDHQSAYEPLQASGGTAPHSAVDACAVVFTLTSTC
jgi:hypothetical protein